MENKEKKEWDSFVQEAIKKFKKDSWWIGILGRLSMGFVFSGLALFVLSLFHLLIKGIVEKVFVELSIAGILLGLGGVVASIVANKLGLGGILFSIAFSRIGEKLENIEVVKRKDNSEK